MCSRIGQEDITVPDEIEATGRNLRPGDSVIISSSDVIPAEDTTQPPHQQRLQNAEREKTK
jgi:hypothetical protein